MKESKYFLLSVLMNTLREINLLLSQESTSVEEKRKYCFDQISDLANTLKRNDINILWLNFWDNNVTNSFFFDFQINKFSVKENDGNYNKEELPISYDISMYLDSNLNMFKDQNMVSLRKFILDSNLIQPIMAINKIESLCGDFTNVSVKNLNEELKYFSKETNSINSIKEKYITFLQRNKIKPVFDNSLIDELSNNKKLKMKFWIFWLFNLYDSNQWEHVFYIDGLSPFYNLSKRKEVFLENTIIHGNIGVSKLKSDEEKEVVIKFIKTVNDILTRLSSVYELYIIKKHYLSKAIKSAIAAIMARNESHNIGSHVLPRVGSALNHPAEIQVLIKYLQERMSFTAQASAGAVHWSIPYRFTTQLMRNFYAQRLILQNIVKSEGLEAYEPNSLVNSCKKDKLSIVILDENENEVYDKDPLVAIPGGVIGTQAFYIILENIIRNAAKHEYAKEETKPELGLEIYVKIDDSNPNNVKISLFSNVTKEIEGIDNEFYKSIINDDGSLVYKNWGFAEMRIGAGFLNKKEAIDAGKGGKNVIKEFIEVKNGLTRYEVTIPKPKFILIIDANETENETDEIKIVNSIDENFAFDYEFVVFKQYDSREINKSWPIRKIILPNNESYINKTRVILYNEWLKKLMQAKGINKVVLNVDTEGEESGSMPLNNDALLQLTIKEYLKRYSTPTIAKALKEVLKEKDKNFSLEEVSNILNGVQLQKFINLKNELQIFYSKKFDEIETIPIKLKNDNNQKGLNDNYCEVFDIDKLVFVKCANNGIDKNNTFYINYIRHFTSSGNYREALSGSQMYFNELKTNDDVFFKLSLIENALIDITIVDERLCDFYESSDKETQERFNNLNLWIGEMVDKEEVGKNILIKNDDTGNNITKTEGDILVVHQTLIDNHSEFFNNVYWGKTENFKYKFVTSGRGEIEENKLQGRKYIHFSNIESALFKTYPEKYLLTQILMKI